MLFRSLPSGAPVAITSIPNGEATSRLRAGYRLLWRSSQNSEIGQKVSSIEFRPALPMSASGPRGKACMPGGSRKCLFLCRFNGVGVIQRSEEHTSELQSLMRNSYAVFCLKKKQINY